MDNLNDSAAVARALDGAEWAHGNEPDEFRGILALAARDKATGQTIVAEAEAHLARPGITRVKIVGTNAEGDRVVCFINLRGAWVIHTRKLRRTITDWQFVSYPDRFSPR
jgi:hypothetical protein